MEIVVMGAVIFLVGAWLGIWPSRRRFGATELKSLSATLAQIHHHLRMGEPYWCPSVGIVLAPPIRCVFEQAWSEGLALTGSIKALGREVSAGLVLGRSCQAVCTLLWSRLALAGGVAILARWLLLPRADFVGITSEGVTAGGLAAAVILLGQWLLHQLLPQPWLMRGPILNPQVATWFAAHVSCETQMGCDVDCQLLALRDRELQHGVSLREEKRMVLTVWSEAQMAAATQRLRQIEDALPLVEFFAVGMPMLLLIAAPLAVFLRGLG